VHVIYKPPAREKIDTQCQLFDEMVFVRALRLLVLEIVYLFICIYIYIHIPFGMYSD